MTRYYLFKKEEKLRSAIGRKEANKYREKSINGFFSNFVLYKPIEIYFKSFYSNK